ncbi:MAG: DHH family phosphoesterase, partial [Patescibacteria group bacterium]
MKWNLISEKIPQNLSELKELLLETREIKNFDSFFNLKNPFDFSLEELEIDEQEVQKAIKLILETQGNKKNILIFGDYDADGISATAIIWQILHNLDCKVLPFIPHRERHGYGLSDKAIDEILAGENRPDLIITVDNGIVAHAEVQRLTDEGIQVIITDHHQPEEELPNADAVVATNKLCGASVAWILMRELFRANHEPKIMNQKSILEKQLDLCGIATIADQVRLKDANRSFAKFGIEVLRKTNRPGLLALFKEAQINKKEIDTYHINYAIAPRINAMGRLEHGLDALRLLVVGSQEKASQLAARLSEVNKKRQDVTQIALESASSKFKNWQDESLIVVSSDDYHEGVIGLIAGKLVDEFYKPAIAISLGGGLAKGSARSISGFNITQLLRQVKDDLLSVGGHPMAAGFSAKSESLELLSSKLRDLAKEQLNQNLLERVLKVEAEI